MKSADFATTFGVEDSGQIDVVRHGPLEGVDDEREIKMELHKLNVYGKDSFKAYGDTLRDQTMFGPPVVIFPTLMMAANLSFVRTSTNRW